MLIYVRSLRERNTLAPSPSPAQALVEKGGGVCGCGAGNHSRATLIAHRDVSCIVVPTRRFSPGALAIPWVVPQLRFGSVRADPSGLCPPRRFGCPEGYAVASLWLCPGVPTGLCRPRRCGHASSIPRPGLSPGVLATPWVVPQHRFGSARTAPSGLCPPRRSGFPEGDAVAPLWLCPGVPSGALPSTALWSRLVYSPSWSLVGVLPSTARSLLSPVAVFRQTMPGTLGFAL
jgi:hypothetical protein